MKTYSVASVHEVFEDNFEIGEGNHVNTYDLNAIIRAGNVRDAIDEYLNDNTYTTIRFRDCEISDCGNYLNAVRMVDIEGQDATNREIEDWKQGKTELFIENIHINAFELIQVNFSHE